jgi:hypothetical protein
LHIKILWHIKGIVSKCHTNYFQPEGFHCNENLFLYLMNIDYPQLDTRLQPLVQWSCMRLAYYFWFLLHTNNILLKYGMCLHLLLYAPWDEFLGDTVFSCLFTLVCSACLISIILGCKL